MGEKHMRMTMGDLHEIVDGLTTALDAKNIYMCGHSERVADISVKLAECIGVSKAEQERIHIGAHLHDIGKIGIPDMILNKPGQLSSAEFAVMKTHPVIGGKIIGKIRLFQDMKDIVCHHHERFDGQGYPDGLKGKSISLGARIVAVADAVDAMSSCRPYRQALTIPEVMRELTKHRGTQFDPMVVEAFLKGNVQEILREIQKVNQAARA